MARFWQNNPLLKRRLAWVVLIAVVAGGVVWWTQRNQSPQDKSMEALSKDLKDPDPKVREESSWVLANKIGAAKEHGEEGQKEIAAVLPAIIADLNDSDPKVRMHLLLALQLIGPPAREAVPALVNLWEHDEKPEVRNAAVNALAAIGLDTGTLTRIYLEATRQAAAAREAAEKKGTWDVTTARYFEAARNKLLEKLGPSDRDALAPLRKALLDENRWVRLAAIEALGKLGATAKPAVPNLLPLLKDPHEDFRKTLRQSSQSAWTRPLLRDPDEDIHKATAEALRAIDPEAAKTAAS